MMVENLQSEDIFSGLQHDVVNSGLYVDYGLDLCVALR